MSILMNWLWSLYFAMFIAFLFLNPFISYLLIWLSPWLILHPLLYFDDLYYGFVIDSIIMAVIVRFWWWWWLFVHGLKAGISGQTRLNFYNFLKISAPIFVVFVFTTLSLSSIDVCVLETCFLPYKVVNKTKECEYKTKSISIRNFTYTCHYCIFKKFKSPTYVSYKCQNEVWCLQTSCPGDVFDFWLKALL